jgi:hypothetical protein
MIQVFIAAQASEKLFDQSFQQTWKKIYDGDPSATVFQHPDYLNRWYRLYTTYQPLIFAASVNGEITELLFLAIQGDEIVGAGHHQAEYQTTLSLEKNKIPFLTDCIRWIIKTQHEKKFTLKYIPHNLNIQELKNYPDIRMNIHLKEYSEPVIRLNAEHLRTELNKKNRREKLNRLKKIGNLNFERITDAAIFRQHLDQLAIDYDFRQAAMFGTAFFQEDRNKKEFMLHLFDSGLLYVTALFSNQTIIAANASTYDKSITYLQGFNTHHPVFAKYSPGILSFLMSALQMEQDGQKEFDLTPGSVNDYKGDLATDFYKTWSLEAGSKTYILKEKFKSTIKSSAKKITKAEFTLRIKDWTHKFLADGNRKTLSENAENPADEPLLKFTDFSLAHSVTENPVDLYAKVSSPDKLGDLLQYQPQGGQPSKQKFLFDAMKRMEYGQHIYTLSVNSKLAGYLWHIPAGAKLILPAGEKSEKDYCFFHLFDKKQNKPFEDFLVHTIGNLNPSPSVRMNDTTMKLFADLMDKLNHG